MRPPSIPFASASSSRGDQMSILDMWGFEWGSNGSSAGLEREGITVTNGFLVYDDPSAPASFTGPSQLCLRAGTNFVTAEVTPENTPSGSQFWLHWRWAVTVSFGLEPTTFVSWNQGGTKIGEVRIESTNRRLEVVIPGTGTFTSDYSVGLDRWRRIHVFVDLQNTATGTVEVYFDGDLTNPILSVTGTVTNPSSLTFNTIGLGFRGGVNFLDDLALMDPLDATGITDPEEIAFFSIGPKQPNGDGNYTGWTAGGSPGGAADYEYIDEVPPDDGDYIEATATSQASTFTFETADPEFVVLAAKWKGRFLRSGTLAGANMNIRQRDVSAATDYDTADIAVPGDGYIFGTFDEKPGGGSWTNADWDDTEWGVVSKT